MFGFVAKGAEAGSENVCHIFAEYDPLQSCNKAAEVIQAAIAKAQTQKDWDNLGPFLHCITVLLCTTTLAIVNITPAIVKLPSVITVATQMCISSGSGSGDKSHSEKTAVTYV